MDQINDKETIFNGATQRALMDLIEMMFMVEGGKLPTEFIKECVWPKLPKNTGDYCGLLGMHQDGVYFLIGRLCKLGEYETALYYANELKGETLRVYALAIIAHWMVRQK